MKKQRIRPQDYPLLYDPQPLSQTNALTKSGLYARFTWRQDLHLLNVPTIPPEVEHVFSRNEETKKATDKLKLMKAIFADELGLNAKETHLAAAESRSNQKERDQQEDSDLSLDEAATTTSAWRTHLPKQALRRIATRSRVPLHMMTSATLAPLPMEKPSLVKKRNSKFLEYAADPRFSGLVDLVKRKNPDSALLGGSARLKRVAWVIMRTHLLFLLQLALLAASSHQKNLSFLSQLQNTDVVLTFDRLEDQENSQDLGSENGYYFQRPDSVVQQQVETYLSQEDGEFLVYPSGFSPTGNLIDIDE